MNIVVIVSIMTMSFILTWRTLNILAPKSNHRRLMGSVSVSIRPCKTSFMPMLFDARFIIALRSYNPMSILGFIITTMIERILENIALVKHPCRH